MRRAPHRRIVALFLGAVVAMVAQLGPPLASAAVLTSTNQTALVATWQGVRPVDLATGSVAAPLPTPNGLATNPLVTEPDGQFEWAAMSGAVEPISLPNLALGTPIVVAPTLTTVTALAVSPDSQTLAVLTPWNATVTLISTATRQVIARRTIPSRFGSPEDLAALPNSGVFAVAAERDVPRIHTVVLSVAKQGAPRLLTSLPFGTGDTDLVMNYQGSTLAIGSMMGRRTIRQGGFPTPVGGTPSVFLVNLQNGVRTGPIPLPLPRSPNRYSVTDLAFAADGRTLWASVAPLDFVLGQAALVKIDLEDRRAGQPVWLTSPPWHYGADDLALSNDGTTAWVGVIGRTDSLVGVNLTTGTRTASIPIDGSPLGLALVPDQ